MLPSVKTFHSPHAAEGNNMKSRVAMNSRAKVRWLVVSTTHQNEQRILNLIYLPQSSQCQQDSSRSSANRANKRLHKKRHLDRAKRVFLGMSGRGSGMAAQDFGCHGRLIAGVLRRCVHHKRAIR